MLCSGLEKVYLNQILCGFIKDISQYTFLKSSYIFLSSVNLKRSLSSFFILLSCKI
jgi:hypothetical protein